MRRPKALQTTAAFRPGAVIDGTGAPPRELGAIILIALVAGAIFAPGLTPFDYCATDTGPRLSPPTTEWGTMLSSGREFMRYSPSVMIFPGLALFLAVVSVNLLGDRLRQILDPRAAD